MPPRRKSQQAEREYEKIKSQLEGLEESVRDRCKKEFTGMGAGRGGAAPALHLTPQVPHLASPHRPHDRDGGPDE